MQFMLNTRTELVTQSRREPLQTISVLRIRLGPASVKVSAWEALQNPGSAATGC